MPGSLASAGELTARIMDGSIPRVGLCAILDSYPFGIHDPENLA